MSALGRTTLVLTGLGLIVSGASAFAQQPGELTRELSPKTSSTSTVVLGASNGVTLAQTSSTASVATTSTAGTDLFGADDDSSPAVALNDLGKELLWLSYPNLNQLGKLITNFIAFMNREQFELADIEETKIKTLQKNLGLSNIPVLTISMVRDARVLTSKGDIGRALALLESAVQISPQLYQVHLVRLNIMLKHQPFAVGKWSRTLLDYGRSRIKGFRNQLGLLLDFTLILVLAILAAVLLFAAVQTLKYVRYVIFFVAQYSPSWLSQVHVLLLLFLVFLSPIILGLGWILSLGLLLTILWPFQGPSERKIGIFCWLGLVSSPAIAILLATPLVQSRSIDNKIVAVISDSDAVDAIIELRKYTETGVGASDIHALNALAQSAWFQGDLDTAKQRYLEVLRLRPDHVAAKNNLGRVLFFRREVEEAKKIFHDAGNSATYAEPVLNYASLLLDEGRFEDAQKAIRMARTVDPARTRHYGSLPASLSTADKLLAVPHQDRFAWQRMRNQDPAELWSVGSRLLMMTGNPKNPLVISIILILLGVTGVFVSYQRKRMGICIPCVKCGRPAIWNAADSHCEQCQTIFLQSLVVDPNKRRLKKQRVHSYQARMLIVERLLGFLPGMSDLFSDRPMRGIARVFIFSGLIVALLLISGFDWNLDELGLETHHFWTGIIGFLSSGMVLLSVRRVWRNN